VIGEMTIELPKGFGAEKGPEETLDKVRRKTRDPARVKATTMDPHLDGVEIETANHAKAWTPLHLFGKRFSLRMKFIDRTPLKLKVQSSSAFLDPIWSVSPKDESVPSSLDELYR
jgi:hypothetical protein